MGATGSPDVVRHSVFNTRDCEETARYSSEFFAVSGLARTHKQEEHKVCECCWPAAGAPSKPAQDTIRRDHVAADVRFVSSFDFPDEFAKEFQAFQCVSPAVPRSMESHFTRARSVGIDAGVTSTGWKHDERAIGGVQ